MNPTDEDWCCDDCNLATDPKTGCMKAGYCRFRDGPATLGALDLPCREVVLPNYVNPKVYRGEPGNFHEWMIDGSWKQCVPKLCRECIRKAACAVAEPMA